MVKKLVDFALDQRAVTIALVLLLVICGLYAYRELPVEAFPDPDDVHVEVITLWPGQAAEDVEAQLTLPAEQQLNGTPGLSGLRSISMFGLSDITCTFEDGVEDNFARSQVLEKMQQVNFPTGAQWQLGAMTTSTGEIFRYVIKTDPNLLDRYMREHYPTETLDDNDPEHRKRQRLAEIRSWEDWVIEPALRQVPGVGDVVAFGGGIKQIQVEARPELLLQHKVTLTQVFTALQNNNANTGGNVLRTGEQSLVVRGVNAIRDLRDIENICVATFDTHPIYVRDVARVYTDVAPRQGIVAWYQKDRDGTKHEVDDIVEAIVLNHKGTNAAKVVAGVKDKIAELNAHVLPKGMQLVTVYDRTDLIHETMHTVLHNLIEGGVLILVISLLFTCNLRAPLTGLLSAFIIWLVIPLALLSAFLFLHVRGVAANLLSFGAVDFGILVDAAVVIVEAVLVAKMVSSVRSAVPVPGGGEGAPNGKPGPSDFRELVRHVATNLGRPMLFSKLILIVALIPIFTFQRVEGRIFRPMAFTIAGAIVGATLVTLTLVPLACAFLLKWGRGATENVISRALTAGYVRLLRVALKVRWATVVIAVLLLAGSIWLGTRLGTEFLPKLDEGNIWLTVEMPLSISADQAKETERRIRDILKRFPESRTIYTQLGRPDDGTDPKGFNNIEIAVYLPPHDQWVTRGPDGKVVDKEGLERLMNAQLDELPGVDFNFSQYIEDNVEEALSGVKGELAVKIFGDDLKVLEEKGEEVRKVMATVKGQRDLAIAEPLSGQPNLTVRVDRDAVARYGLDGQTVLSLVETGLGGKVSGSILQGQRRFDICLRLNPSARNAVNRISDLWVDTPTGQRIPLKNLASITLEEGAARIGRDKNSRRIAIKCGIEDRDMGSFVDEARQKVKDQVQLPPGYSITWEGQFENQERANARLKIIIPLSLLLVLGLLFWAFQRLRYAVLILANVPFAVLGAILLLYLTGTHLSVSASIGFIALSGVSVQNGIVLIGQFNQLRVRGMPLHEAVVEGSRSRLRPVLMTALMAAIGMYPAATSTGIGSEVQRPLALVILGGMISAVLLTLLVLPALYEMFESYFPARVTVPEGLVE